MNYKNASYILIAGLSLLRLLYINTFPLLGDEAYYWQWSRHLDFGYYEQGPVLAFVIWIFTFFGTITSVFTIRLGAVVLSAITMLITLRICSNANPSDKDGKTGFLTLLILNSAVIYSAGAVLMMHDTVMVFFLSLFMWQMSRVIEYPSKTWGWALAGVLLALGVMSKYTMGTLYFCVLFFIIISPQGFKNYIKGFAVFTLFFILFLSPVIYWNLTHDFSTLHYLLGRKGTSSSFTLKHFGELIGGQIALNSPLMIVFYAAGIIAALKTAGSPYKRFLAFIFIVSITPYIFLSLKNRVEANWPAYTFLPLFILAGAYISGLKKQPRFFAPALGFGAITVIATHLLLSGSLPLPPKSDPMRKASGFRELALSVKSFAGSLPSSENTLFFTSAYYQHASLLSFYYPGRPVFYITRIDEAAKNYRFWRNFEGFSGHDSLFVWSENHEFDNMKLLFSGYGETREFPVIHRGKEIRRFKITHMKGYGSQK